MFIKYSFPLTHLFLCYQTLENMENYLYTRFSIETNGKCIIYSLYFIKDNYSFLKLNKLKKYLLFYFYKLEINNN